MKIFTSPASRTFNSINRTFSKSFSYDDKSYMGIENTDLKHRIIKNSFSRTSNLSTKSYKRNLIYRVSASFIPSCVLAPNRDPTEELYRLFPQLPPGEKPLDGFTCALHKDILLQGKLIICSNCICFHSNIFGYETRVIIYFKNVLAIRREKTAFVVPNAISIVTLNKRYFFCSFLSRETVYKLLLRVWKSTTLGDVDANENDIKDGELKLRPKLDSNHGKIDRSHNFYLFSSSSSSYESSTGGCYFRGLDFPHRPHTTPPSVTNLAFIPQGVTESRKYYNSLDSSGSESDVEDGDIVLNRSFENRHDFVKSVSLGDMRELNSIEASVGPRKIEKIGKEMLAKHEKYAACNTHRTKHSIFSPFDIVNRATSIVSRIQLHHSAFWCMSFLILLLAMISISLLLRINHVSSSVQNIQKAPLDTMHNENLEMRKLFEFRDELHAARVERMKSILSVNLETVNEVQEALQELKRKLQ